jgi:hypothetical protein
MSCISSSKAAAFLRTPDVAVSTEDAICLQKSTKLKLDNRRLADAEILTTNARFPAYPRFAVAASK